MNRRDQQLSITVLCDNRALPGFGSEHGWAALVETGGRRVLLDTGSGSSFLPNADRAGVDLLSLDALVLSHGHYDHTGALAALLERTGPLDVFAHPAIFEQTFADRGDGVRQFIGMPLEREQYEQLGARFHLSPESVEVVPGVRTTGYVPRTVTGSVPAPHLLRTRDGVTGPEDFPDDLSLVLDADDGIVILTGCAHAALPNILARAAGIAPDRRIWALLGGTHLVASQPDEVRRLARYLAECGVVALGPSHCTGDASAAVLREAFPGRFLEIAAGRVIRVLPGGAVQVS